MEKGRDDLHARLKMRATQQLGRVSHGIGSQVGQSNCKEQFGDNPENFNKDWILNKMKFYWQENGGN